VCVRARVCECARACVRVRVKDKRAVTGKVSFRFNFLARVRVPHSCNSVMTGRQLWPGFAFPSNQLRLRRLEFTLAVSCSHSEAASGRASRG
jgi:hypothetical protein